MGSKRARHLKEDLLERLRPGPTRPRADRHAGAGEAFGAPLSVRGLTRLQRDAGNQAVTQLVAQRAQQLVVQRDWEWPYGGPNSTPHIHQYPSGAHLKISDRGKIRRIQLVQDGKRYGDNVAEAFDLVRAVGDSDLLAALKEVIAGVPFAKKGS